MRRRTLGAAMLAAPVLSAWSAASRAATAFWYIGSGSAAGLYHPTAERVAAIVNGAKLDLRAYVEATGGSIENCLSINADRLQLGFAQNNIAWYASQGEGIDAFIGRPQQRLRGLLMLYPEVIHVLVRKDAGIQSMTDLREKLVYVGDEGSGTTQDVNNLLSVWGMGFADLKAAVYGRSGDAIDLLRQGQLAAMFYTVGMGAPAIVEAMATGQLDLLPMPVQTVDTLRARMPFYTLQTIPANTYPGINHNLPAVALKAMLMASDQLAADKVQAFMDLVFDRELDKFINNPLNPNLKREFNIQTALQGMPIALHPGAERFFRARGFTIPPVARALE